MKKSVLFSFFALLFATFGFGGISMADTEITEIHITWNDAITSVTAGPLPSFSGFTYTTTPSDVDGFQLDSYHDDQYGNTRWMKKTGGNSYSAVTTSGNPVAVADGSHYVMQFSINCVSSNCHFSDNLKIYYNDTDVSNMVFQAGEIEKRLRIDLGEAIAPIISNINITGIIDPVLGATAATGGITITSTPEDEIEVLSVFWGAKPNNSDPACELGHFACRDHGGWQDTTFSYESEDYPNKYYYLRIKYHPNYSLADNYTITSDGNGNVTTGYDSCSYGNGFCPYIQLEYPASQIEGPLPTEISEIRFNGPESVFSGQNLAVVLQISNVDDIDLSGYNFGVYTGVKKDGGNWVALDSTETVAVSGTHYGMKVPITIDSGFVLSDTPSFYYNGVKIDDAFVLEGETMYVYIDVGVAIVAEPIPVESVEFTGIVFPVVGKTMLGELVRIQSIQESLAPDVYRIVDYHFYLGSGDQWIKMDEDDIFIAGTGYKLDFLVELNDKILYSFVGLLTGTMNGEYFDDLNISGDQVVLSKLFTPISVVETTPSPAAAGGGSGGGSAGTTPSTAAKTNTNAETKAVDKTDDMNLNPSTNELIKNNYVWEELENNKELYKNAPLKVFVALYNLKKYDIFSLKQTAEAYKNASVAGRQKCLSLLSSFSKGDSKRAKYVSDYFKFLVGIE